MTGKPAPHPLAERLVVVTRPEAADGPLSRELHALGLAVLCWPAVSVTPCDRGALDAALAEAGTFGWIVFASRHAVAAVLARLQAPPAGVRIAAVGQATALTLRRRGWPVDLAPEEGSAAALIDAFAALWRAQDRGTRVLYPASSRALPTIANGLTQLGAHVLQVEAYRTEGATLDVESCRAHIARGDIAAVTFASPSAVSELARSLGGDDFHRLLSGAPAIAIGRTTAREITAHGHRAVVAEAATLRSLAVATLRVLDTKG